MRRMHHVVLALLLGVSLLIGQQAGLRHDIDHAVDRLERQDSLPAPAKCDNHSLYASLASALGGDPPVAPYLASVILGISDAATRQAWLAPRYSFRSRAPPASSV